MQLEAHADAPTFLSAAARVLEADEARHNLIYGICSTAVEAPQVYPHARFWTVHEEERVVGAALMTPPFNIVLARPLHPEAFPFAARSLHGRDLSLPGVTAAVPEVEAFATAWAELNECTTRVRMRLGVYAVSSVVTPAGVAGGARKVQAEDRDLVVEWLHAFEDEAMHPDSVRADHAEWFDRRLTSATAGVVLWEDEGLPVSLCGYGGSTPHGVRIGPVYTPPPFRRRGYAGA